VNLLNLKCGSFNLLYENGLIRKIKIGETEIIRMIFAAVRDHNWGTLPPVILKETIDHSREGFTIQLETEYIQKEINFRANYIIRGEQNQISFEMHGKAMSSFLKNRIGICVLHPVKECAGIKATVIHNDNTIEDFKFPKQIAPHQPLKNIKQLSWEPASGIKARLDFFGDVFEMEDQRNWTDASYKIYSTPLELPFPVRVKEREEFSQKIVLNADLTRQINKQTDDQISFCWDNESKLNFPEWGLGASSTNRFISSEEVDLLSGLQIGQLRVDIHLEKADWQKNLNKVVRDAELLNTPLFLCVYLNDNYHLELNAFLDFIGNWKHLLKAILPVGLNHLSHPSFNEIAKEIRKHFPKVKTGTGVNGYFAELNRNRPEVSQADFVSFAVCPQVHAVDEISIYENLEGLAEVIKSAKTLFPKVPVWISPITLKQRFNVVATEDEKYTGPEELAPQVDSRQSSMFAANWTLGAFKQLAQSGADLVDFYETAGWRGILNMELTSNLLPEYHKPVFPLFYLFRVLSEIEYLHPSVSSHPELIDGLVFKKEGFTEIVFVNYSEENQKVNLPLNDRKARLFSLSGYRENSDFFTTCNHFYLPPHCISILRL